MMRSRFVLHWRQVCISSLGMVALVSAAAGDGPRQRGDAAAFTLPRNRPETNAPSNRATAAKAWKILIDGVGNEKAEKRAKALAALETIGPRPEVLRLVEARLTDKEAEVRQTAAAALGAMKARAAIPELRSALDDASADVSFAAARALWEMGDHTGRDIVYQVLGAERNPVKEAAGSELKSASKTLRNPKSLGLLGAEQAAEMLLGPFALGINVVEEIAKDRSAPQRVAAASMLASARDTESLEQLKAALTDKNWLVRAAAATALGARGDRRAIAQLAPVLGDDKDPVRFMAAAAIVRLSRLQQRGS